MFYYDNNFRLKCFVAISITAAITTLQLSSTVFSGLSSSSSALLSKTADVASSTQKITDTISALQENPNDTTIPSAVAQEEEGDAGEGEGGDEFISEPEGGGPEKDVPVEDGDTGAELVEPTTTTMELNCNDGIDDDGDGLIDNDDTDCLQPPTSPSTSTADTENRSGTEEQVPPTSEFVSPQAQTEEFCGDNVDNNGNGQIDEGCPDLGAAASPLTPTPTPSPPPLTDDLAAEIPTPSPSPSPTPCPPTQIEPDTGRCELTLSPQAPARSPSPVPSPQQQTILPPLLVGPTQPGEGEGGTAGPAGSTIVTPTPSPSPPPLTDDLAVEIPSPTQTPSPTPCPPGQEREPDGGCAPTPPTPCPPGLEREPDGGCAPIPTLTPTPSPLTITSQQQPTPMLRPPAPPGGERTTQTVQQIARFQNDPELTVKVIVNNDNGIGTLTPSNFRVHVTGTNPRFGTPSNIQGIVGASPANFQVYSPAGVRIIFEPGEFGVTIDEQPRVYTTATQGTCSGTAFSDESLSCTFILDDRPQDIRNIPIGQARLIVKVNVRNDDGATLGAGETEVRVNGLRPSPRTFLGEWRPGGTVVRLDPGTYSVTAGIIPPVRLTAAPAVSGGTGSECTPSSGQRCQPALPVVPLRPGVSASPTRPPGGIPPGTLQTGNLFGFYRPPFNDQFRYFVAYSSECSSSTSGPIRAGETRVCNVFLDDGRVESSRLIISATILDPELIPRLGLSVWLVPFGSYHIRDIADHPASFPVYVNPGWFQVALWGSQRETTGYGFFDLLNHIADRGGYRFSGDCRDTTPSIGEFDAPQAEGHILPGETKRCNLVVSTTRAAFDISQSFRPFTGSIR